MELIMELENYTKLMEVTKPLDLTAVQKKLSTPFELR